MRIIGSVLALVGLAAFGALIFVATDEPPNRQMLMALSAASVLGTPLFIGGCVLIGAGAIVRSVRGDY